MKLCFFIVGHGRLDCYAHQAYFFNNFKHIHDYDVVIYENSNASLEEIQQRTQHFHKPPLILHNRHNHGYYLGQLYALNECYELLKQYDYVVQHTCDSFIVRDNYVNDWLINLRHCDSDLLSNQFLFSPNSNSYVSEPTFCYGSDFFIFNPSRFKQEFWQKALTFGNIPPELILYKLTKENNNSVLLWPRLFVTKNGQHLCAPKKEDLAGLADTSNILHTHNLDDLTKYK